MTSHDSTSRRRGKHPAEVPEVPRDFPLWVHKGTGRWFRRIDGRAVYFGPLADWQGALVRYHKHLDDRARGVVPGAPQVDPGTADVYYVVNAFLTVQEDRVASGEMSPLSFASYKRTGETMARVWGDRRLVATLRPGDFVTLRAAFARTHGPSALQTDVQQVRTIFNWAFQSELLTAPPRFGPDFKRPSKTAVRRARMHKNRMFEAHELRALLKAAREPLRTMILLAVNAGLGPTDLAELRWGNLDLGNRWLNMPRRKTAIPRRVPLWAEAVAALEKWRAMRPAPADKADSDRVFLNAIGRPWTLRSRQNLISIRFRELLDRVGLRRAGASFYVCRHVVETIAGETGDQVATDWIMGHRRGEMSEEYRERVSDQRLQAAVERVRQWLFPPPDPAGDGADVVPFQVKVG